MPLANQYEIYLITAPGYWYVGSTVRGAPLRLEEHKNGRGGAKLLYAKMLELGFEAFTITVVESNHGDPIRAETRWYDFYKAHDVRQSLNGRRPGGWDGFTRKGQRLTPEHRAKISSSHLGKPSARKGTTVSPETRAKMSEAQRSRPHSPFTPTHRANLAKALKGKGNNSLIVECSCGMRSNPGAMARHFRKLGHEKIL